MTYDKSCIIKLVQGSGEFISLMITLLGLQGLLPSVNIVSLFTQTPPPLRPEVILEHSLIKGDKELLPMGLQIIFYENCNW